MSHTLAAIEPTTGRKPAVLRSAGETRAQIAAWRRGGDRIALVPTMGALHDGHLSLVRLAQEKADRTIVSIFVNPTQFAPSEDFEKYPRTFEADAARLASVGADAIFAPQAAAIYPEGFSTAVTVKGPATAGLEDRFRPDHFGGVATVVAKLHNIVAPDIAIYGEKDFQQLAVIRQMNRDLDLPVEVLGGATIRAGDGLALSSRNAYLSESERSIAPLLYRTLCACRDAIANGEAPEPALERGRQALAAAGFKTDYLELRDAQTLAAPALADRREGRLLVAARLGATRLIDNIAVPAFRN
ncbi:MAG: pantoate--beta-alanine ligase [Beijerinckiaceae bacterium]